MDIYEIVACLEGTCDTVDTVIGYLDLDIEADDLEDMLADTGIERCPLCDW